MNLSLRRLLPLAGALGSFSLLTACGGADLLGVTLTGDAGQNGAKESGAGGEDAGSTRSDSGHPAADASGGTADAGGGPRVYIRIASIQTPTGSSGPSQETPSDQRVGILGVELLKAVGDPSPLVVLANATPTDTPYNDGSSTLIGSVPSSALTPGTYNVVRVPVAYVNFTVAGTAHSAAGSVAGDFTDVIALTSGTTLMGSVRQRGWYSTSFAVGGSVLASAMGSDAEIAQPGPASGIGLDLSGPVAAYVFPLTLTIPSDIKEDMEIVFTANTYQDFHWTDQATAGYTAGVFDVSATSFEPVTQLGANSATVTIAPVTTP